MLHPPSAADASLRARFLREGYLANQVGHPGAVSILDDDVTEDGHVYLVMELLEGDTLEELRIESGGKMAIGDVLTIVDQTLDVLVAAHDRKIVHRDIKPANLFVTLAGTLKVLDFGIARLDDASTTKTAATTFSSAMGTIGFMAPEQARGRWELVDARTDLWSLGATMFELLAGRLVHQAATSNEMLLAAMTQQAPPIASCTSDLHEAAAKIVDRALAYERDDRWADARTMQKAVRTAYQELTGHPLTPLPATVARIRRSGPPPSPSAPTLPALSGPSPAMPTTRRMRAMTGLPTRRSTAGIAAAVLGLIATFVGVAAMRRGPPRAAATVSHPVAVSDPGESAVPSRSSVPPASTELPRSSLDGSVVEDAPAPTTAPMTKASMAMTLAAGSSPTAASASGHSATTVRSHPAPAATPTTETPTASATVDLFGRRK
jgi:serine/threonine protein kinase